MRTPFNIGNLFQEWASEKAQPEGLTGHHQMPGRSWRAGQPCGDGKPVGPDRPPLKGGVNKPSSDDRPGPGICGSKYVEDAKAARSVRVWDRVPIK